MKQSRTWIALGVVTLAVSLMVGCGPQNQAPDGVKAADSSSPASDEVQYLFVHGAKAGSISDGVLRLGGVSPSTIYFSDRPERIAGHLTTEEFVANWGEGDDSFESNPPNATLSILTGPEPQEIVVVLTNPRLEDGDLIYNVDILEGAASATGGECSLFIDVIGRPLTPLSYAGAARRTTRRVVRRTAVVR